MLSFRCHAMFPGYVSHRHWHLWMSFGFCIDTNKPYNLSIEDVTISVHKCYNISMRKSEKIPETNVQLYLSVIISLYCIWCKRKDTSNFWIPNKDKLWYFVYLFGYYPRIHLLVRGAYRKCEIGREMIIGSMMDNVICEHICKNMFAGLVISFHI